MKDTDLLRMSPSHTPMGWLTFWALGMSVWRCARTERAALAGLRGAQYISSLLRSQLRKQHSSTMPVWGALLLLEPYPVGLSVKSNTKWPGLREQSAAFTDSPNPLKPLLSPYLVDHTLNSSWSFSNSSRPHRSFWIPVCLWSRPHLLALTHALHTLY